MLYQHDSAFCQGSPQCSALSQNIHPFPQPQTLWPPCVPPVCHSETCLLTCAHTHHRNMSAPPPSPLPYMGRFCSDSSYLASRRLLPSNSPNTKLFSCGLHSFTCSYPLLFRVNWLSPSECSAPPNDQVRLLFRSHLVQEITFHSLVGSVIGLGLGLGLAAGRYGCLPNTVATFGSTTGAQLEIVGVVWESPLYEMSSGVLRNRRSAQI